MTTRSESEYLKFTVASSYSELETVVDKSHAFCELCRVSEAIMHKVMLLTSEAVTNAMKHGNRLVADKKVDVEFIHKDDVIEVWVEDEGDGFVRKDVPNPLAEEHLLDVGGRGIFLIERMADRVEYERDGRRIGMFFDLTA